MRWYVAFRLRDPNWLSPEILGRHQLLEIIRNQSVFSKTFKATLGLINSILNTDVTIPEKRALWRPRRISDYDDSTIVMFLDEFQNTRLPQHNLDVVGYMQEAVESPTCPHFVTGSSMSILAREILGRGSLFGRFRSKPIDSLTGYWGTQLVNQAALLQKSEIIFINQLVIILPCFSKN